MSFATDLKCLKCGLSYSLNNKAVIFGGCHSCKTDKFLSPLIVSYDYKRLTECTTRETFGKKGSGLWSFSDLLPVQDNRYQVTLDEGHTPLIKSNRLNEELDLDNLFIKDESRNPTWSFKDRNCCCAISKGIELGATVAVIASSGNHGASTAAYASKAGIQSVIFTKGSINDAFTTQIQAYGGLIVPVTTSEGRWILMERCVKEKGWYPMGSYTNPMPTGQPFGIEGSKTLGYEIIQDLDWRVPEKVVLPLGLGEGFYGTWKGLSEMGQLGLVDNTPSMISVEVEDGAPLAKALNRGLDHVEKIAPAPSTLASSIATSITSYQAMRAIKDSTGIATSVSDEMILAAQKLLASKEGLYSEPASAAAVAGVRSLREEGRIDRDETIVIVLTSTGMKDPYATTIPPPITAIEPKWESFLDFIHTSHGLSD